MIVCRKKGCQYYKINAKRPDRLSNQFGILIWYAFWLLPGQPISMITGHFSPAKRPVWLSNQFSFFFFFFFADCFRVNIFLTRKQSIVEHKYDRICASPSMMCSTWPSQWRSFTDTASHTPIVSPLGFGVLCTFDHYYRGKYDVIHENLPFGTNLTIHHWLLASSL